MTISYTQLAFKRLGVALKLLGYWDIGIAINLLSGNVISQYPNINQCLITCNNVSASNAISSSG